MTKFILHGGESSKPNPDNRYFFRLFTQGLTGKVKILLNYFSQPEEKWSDKSKQDISGIKKNNLGKELDFEIADSNCFEVQLQDADILHMRGGNIFLLLEQLKKYKNFFDLIKCKTVIGSSAGAYAVAKYYTLPRYYYGQTINRQIQRGLGILDIKIHCHHKPTDQVIVNKLKKSGEDLDIIVLPKYKSVIMYR
ncbi:MAG: Type 1 glutamine amidotransferase-like domain-containing protein [Patescibacteria group bacterium]|nr:Type 1 glutamine amidotransferase-like domain-containing protein [Patescibacteria group bacterium]